MTAPMTKPVAIFSLAKNWSAKNAGIKCKSATNEPASNSADNIFLTPILSSVETMFTDPAMNNATTECSYKKAADVVSDINVKNI